MIFYFGYWMFCENPHLYFVFLRMKPDDHKILHLCLLIWVFFFVLPGNSLYVSDQLSNSICEQHLKFTEGGELQKPEKSPSGKSGGENDQCGWYQVTKGKDAGCSASIANFLECKTVEERQSPEFYGNLKQKVEERRKAKAEGSGRIVGGVEPKRHEFPSLLLMVINGIPHCGATLISPQWAVSAAHCSAPNPEGYTLVAGQLQFFSNFHPFFHFVLLLMSHYSCKFFQREEHAQNETDEENPVRQIRKVVLYKIHEKYGQSGGNYDVGVLKVEPPFDFNDNIKAATLPQPDYRADGMFTTAGWGDKSENSGERSDLLFKVDVPFVDDETCAQKFQAPTKTSEDEICAGFPEGGKDTCQGDSGGPLYKIGDGDEQLLAGIVSWGNGCARPESPGVYAEVAYYVDWIKKNACL